jgi:polyferredoxin
LISRKSKARRRIGIDRIARKLVQIGFLVLFLFPFIPPIYQRLTYQPVPVFSSWLLLWDPFLLFGQLLRREWTVIVIGAPLVFLSLVFVLGRSFCGWICPVGTILDVFQDLMFWKKGRVRKTIARGSTISRNSRLRYYLLFASLAGAILSLQWVAWFDPFVLFQRVSSSITSNAFSMRNPGLRIYFSAFSLLFMTILALEFWKPRFWCRNLCPMGALISLFSRWSLLNRKVNTACTSCGECLRTCPMQAIPREVHDTDYGDCTFCLECQDSCPREGIYFGFGILSNSKWQKEIVARETRPSFSRNGKYVPVKSKLSRLNVTRRQFINGLAAGAAGFALVPIADLNSKKKGVIRPPGVTSEEDFIHTCIICQECVRVCPTGGLRPTFLESGISGLGTPQLVARQGGCSINPSCPQLCAKVCPVGAIPAIEPGKLKIGLAAVDHSLCLAWDQGSKCLVCVEACLNNAAQAFQGRVTIDPQKCTGCGRCESGCPVAGSAIRIYPLV